MQHSKTTAFKKWFEYASHDLRVTKLCLDQPDEAFLKAAAFHLQQACEKVLKGVLNFHGIKFNKTHNLIELGSLVVEQHPLSESLISKIIPLNKYVIISRYPMDDEVKKSDILRMLPFVQQLFDYFIGICLEEDK